MIEILAPAMLALQIAAPADLPVGRPVDEWNCEDPQVQQEMNLCAELDYSQADKELNAQWKITSAWMKQRDDDWKYSRSFERYKRPGWHDTLLEAQRAWIGFRDAHCRIEGYVARGGSLEPLLLLTCKATLTRSRTRDLREMIEAER